MTVRSSAVRRGLAGLLAVSALAAGGCSAQSGAAAVVEGRAISVADVHAATEELRPFLQDATPASILVVLIAEPTFRRAAAAAGVGVSQQEARSLLEQLASDAPGAAPQFGDASLAVARFTLLQQGLQELPDAQGVLGGISEELTELDVDVNPRFGELDFAAGGITPVVHPWIVQDEAAAP